MRSFIIMFLVNPSPHPPPPHHHCSGRSKSRLHSSLQLPIISSCSHLCLNETNDRGERQHVGTWENGNISQTSWLREDSISSGSPMEFGIKPH
mmetsp:Transcript_41111/g.67374  ORF Transcript_41111/g.67374 Transcript_41111/m.67374 type:complete len:93 (-) Transcript_41111:291-569(-)